MIHSLRPAPSPTNPPPPSTRRRTLSLTNTPPSRTPNKPKPIPSHEPTRHHIPKTRLRPRHHGAAVQQLELTFSGNAYILARKMANKKRICRTCNLQKSPKEFYKDTRYPNGDIHCADCRRAKVKKWRDANIEKARLVSKLSTAKNPTRARESARRWHIENRDRHLAYMAQRRKLFPDAIISSKLKAAFGINIDEYAAMLNTQGGVCAICKKTPEVNKKRLAVDHCHNSKKVRGLLCSTCNSAIGLLRDDISILKSAIQYIRKSTSK